MIRKTAALVATMGLMAAPAAAQDTPAPSSKSAPQTICKGLAKKKVGNQKKSLFAECVSGAKKTQAKIDANKAREARGQKPARVVPGQICKTASKKKAEGQTKSPFAACVKGATETNKAAREAARQA